MKILILINLFALLQSNCYSQKCKFDVDKYDKFLKVNKLEKEIKAVKTFNRGNGYLTLNLCKYGDDIFFRLSTASNNPITVGSNDAVIFLLDNEETIKAYPRRIYSGDYNGARFLFEGTYHFEISSDFDKLKKSNVKSIRLYYSSVYKDFDLKGNGQESLIKAANCF